jgi:hypothetical protein
MSDATPTPLAGEELEPAIAEKIRQRKTREEANLADNRAITKRTAEIVRISAELEAMRAAQRANIPYVPGATAAANPVQ